MLYSGFNSVFSVGQHPLPLKLMTLKCSLTSESRYSNDKEGIIYYLNDNTICTLNSSKNSLLSPRS
jgi:hypothetical protein